MRLSTCNTHPHPSPQTKKKPKKTHKKTNKPKTYRKPKRGQLHLDLLAPGLLDELRLFAGPEIAVRLADAAHVELALEVAGLHGRGRRRWVFS